MNKIILIVEDDSSFIVEVEMMMIGEGNYSFISAKNIREANAKIELNPYLIILDLRLGDNELGVELLETISQRNIPFIVTTAFSDKDLYDKIKSYNPKAYLIKPFDKLTLLGAIDRIQTEINSQQDEVNLQGIFVKENKEHKKILFGEIIYIKAEGNYCSIFMEHKRIAVRNSIKSFVEAVPDETFIRVHRSYIINSEYIESIDFSDNAVYLKGDKIPIGRNFKKEFKNRMLRS